MLPWADAASDASPLLLPLWLATLGMILRRLEVAQPLFATHTNAGETAGSPSAAATKAVDIEIAAK